MKIFKNKFPNSTELIKKLKPDIPIFIFRPHRLIKAAQWFCNNFPGEIYYAVKSNPSPHILQTLWENSIHCFDVASLYEIKLIYSLFPTAKMAFMHPIKNPNVIYIAYHYYKVRRFVLDSMEELDKIIFNISSNLTIPDDLILIVRIKVNNDGSCLQLTNKFGCTGDYAVKLIQATRKVSKLLGISFHVGSQSIKPNIYSMGLDNVIDIIQKAQVKIDIIDVGGGFPSIYNMECPPPLINYIQNISNAINKSKCFENIILWCEPGRGLVAESEGLITRIEGIKNNCIYLNDGSYGALYDSVHEKWNYPFRVIKSSGTILYICLNSNSLDSSNLKLINFDLNDLIPYTIYGPTCDSADKFPDLVFLPKSIESGDYLEWGNIGAYGRSMATQFNGYGYYQTIITEDSPWNSIFI